MDRTFQQAAANIPHFPRVPLQSEPIPSQNSTNRCPNPTRFADSDQSLHSRSAFERWNYSSPSREVRSSAAHDSSLIPSSRALTPTFQQSYNNVEQVRRDFAAVVFIGDRQFQAVPVAIQTPRYHASSIQHDDRPNEAYIKREPSMQTRVHHTINGGDHNDFSRTTSRAPHTLIPTCWPKQQTKAEGYVPKSNCCPSKKNRVTWAAHDDTNRKHSSTWHPNRPPRPPRSILRSVSIRDQLTEQKPNAPKLRDNSGIGSCAAPRPMLQSDPQPSNHSIQNLDRNSGALDRQTTNLKSIKSRQTMLEAVQEEYKEKRIRSLKNATNLKHNSRFYGGRTNSLPDTFSRCPPPKSSTLQNGEDLRRSESPNAFSRYNSADPSPPRIPPRPEIQKTTRQTHCRPQHHLKTEAKHFSQNGAQEYCATVEKHNKPWKKPKSKYLKAMGEKSSRKTSGNLSGMKKSKAKTKRFGSRFSSPSEIPTFQKSPISRANVGKDEPKPFSPFLPTRSSRAKLIGETTKPTSTRNESPVGQRMIDIRSNRDDSGWFVTHEVGNCQTTKCWYEITTSRDIGLFRSQNEAYQAARAALYQADDPSKNRIRDMDIFNASVHRREISWRGDDANYSLVSIQFIDLSKGNWIVETKMGIIPSDRHAFIEPERNTLGPFQTRASAVEVGKERVGSICRRSWEGVVRDGNLKVVYDTSCKWGILWTPPNSRYSLIVVRVLPAIKEKRESSDKSEHTLENFGTNFWADHR
ncbi:unnamed protein product [Agarophyton chilense]